MKPEVVERLWNRYNSTISTKINMRNSRLFYPFGISSARDSQMVD